MVKAVVHPMSCSPSGDPDEVGSSIAGLRISTPVDRSERGDFQGVPLLSFLQCI